MRSILLRFVFLISGKIQLMANEKEYYPQIAMSIQAHPDDQDYTVAGTLAKWAKAGCKVISVLITSGDSGSNDVTQGADYKAELARLRVPASSGLPDHPGQSERDGSPRRESLSGFEIGPGEDRPRADLP